MIFSHILQDNTAATIHETGGNCKYLLAFQYFLKQADTV